MIHGAFYGGWCWGRLAPHLLSAGCDVYTPTLTGIGERAHLARPATNLSTHVDDILDVIDSDRLRDVVLCAWSYGGMVARCVADQISTRITRIVYIDALVPTDGQSVMNILEPRWVDAFRAGAKQGGDGWKIPPVPPDEYGVVDPRDAAMFAQRATPQPLATFEQAAILTNGPGGQIASTYIRCARFVERGMDHMLAKLSHDPALRVVTVPYNHAVMVTAPEMLAREILGHQNLHETPEVNDRHEPAEPTKQ